MEVAALQFGKDSVLCFVCVQAKREKGVVVTGNLGSCDQAFVKVFNLLI